MEKIMALTPEQESQLKATYEHWLKVGRNTAPIDKGKAHEAIGRMYDAIQKPRPAFLHFTSPMIGMLAIAILRAANKKGENFSQFGSQLRGKLGGQLWGQLCGKLRDELRGQLEGKLRGQLWGQLRGQLRDELRGKLRGQLGGQLWSQLEGQLRGQLGGELADKLEGQLWGRLEGRLWGQIWGQLWDRLNWNYFGGQHWCAWEVYYDFANRIGVEYTPEQRETLDLWLEQSRQCAWWWPMDGVCVTTDRHSVLMLDDRGRLHCENGPAVAYPDGWAIHAVHGVVVPADVIEQPESITVQRIEQESNAEVRRVMIERYGQDRYMRDSSAMVVQELSQDHPLIGLRTAKLLRKDVRDDEPIIMLDMLNSTPEPDGSVKRYMLRIDPNAYDGEASRNCHAAMASSYRLSDGSLLYHDWRDYAPLIET